MLKSVAAAGALLSAFIPLAASVASVPLLSGNYIYTSQKFCQMNVTVTYGTSTSIKGTPFVTQVGTPGSTPNTISLGAGALNFKPTATASGSVSINGFQADGSPILLKSTGSGIGAGGTQGAPLQTDTESGTGTFSQTATTLVFKQGGGTTNYHIYYGKLAGTIVQSATFVGVDTKGCVEQFSLSHG